MRPVITKVVGLENVTRNLNEEIKKLTRVTFAGLLDAGLQIQNVAQSRTPVDTGNLKASAYTRKAMGGRLAVEIGFTASYAIYVHENLEARHTNGEAKFLERAILDNKDAIIEIIRRRAAMS